MARYVHNQTVFLRRVGIAWESFKQRIHALVQEIDALYWASRDQRTPWYAKAWALLVLAYALSPIDLIPDFIPVLGYLDDLLLIPLGIWLALKMIPSPVIQQARIRAQQAQNGLAVPRWLSVVLVAGIWALAVAVVVLVRQR